MPTYPMPRQLPAEPQPGQPGEPAPVGPTGPTSPPSLSGLLGQAGSNTSAPTASPEDHAEALLTQFRELSTQIQALARQYPAAGQDLAVCNDSLINAMTKIVASMQAEPSTAPPTLM